MTTTADPAAGVTLVEAMATVTELAPRDDLGQRTRTDIATATDVASTAIRRAHRPGYQHWINHTAFARGCIRPIRLSGRLHTVDTTTGEVLSSRSTATMPDGVVYAPCGDRRAAVCPACAETYRADTYHLIKSGLTGGKGVPESVASHPAVFTTLTAPSFGPVHTSTTDQAGRVTPCRPRRTMTLCPHGRPQWCPQRHTAGSGRVGTPLCPDCYDYPAHAVWNAFAGELWRRTLITLRRLVRRLGKSLGLQLDVAYGKVAEYQERGAVHFHAIIRLDLIDPTDPTTPLPPPSTLHAGTLDELITQAVAATGFRTPPHPGNHATAPNPHGWPITWGRQLLNRPLARLDGGDITENQVAGYVAKYATKATEITGFTARRLTTDTIALVADPDTHAGRLAHTAFDLGANPHDTGKTDRTGTPLHPEANRPITPQRAHWDSTYGRLRRWAHMLGFGGHFTTKSQRYGPTRKHLKHTRREWQRSQQLHHHSTHRTAEHTDDPETTLIVGQLQFAGIGWHTTGDAILATSAAARAREHHNTAKQERTAS